MSVPGAAGILRTSGQSSRSSLRNYAAGGVIPLCFGHYSEFDKTGDKVVRLLAEHVVSQDSGLALFSDSDAPRILKSHHVYREFVRLLGCELARMNANLKIDRVGLLAPDVVAAIRKTARLCLDPDKRRYKSSIRPTDRPSWFISDSRDEEAFRAWEVFRAIRRVNG